MVFLVVLREELARLVPERQVFAVLLYPSPFYFAFGDQLFDSASDDLSGSAIVLAVVPVLRGPVMASGSAEILAIIWPGKLGSPR